MEKENTTILMENSTQEIGWKIRDVAGENFSTRIKRGMSASGKTIRKMEREQSTIRMDLNLREHSKIISNMARVL